MGKLTVESITAENFMSYHKPQTIRLGGRGPLAVVGSNGVGKSTLVSKALAWGLYGTCAPERMGSSTKALRGKDVLRKKFPLVRPEHAATPDATEARVSVILTEGAVTYTIIRTRRKTGSDTVMVHVEDPTSGFDGVDGDDQAYIDRLIGGDYTVFVRTCLRGQNDPWNFAEATDAKKREILDAISGADQLDEAYKRAKAAHKVSKGEAQTYLVRAEDSERRAGTIDVGDLERQQSEWADHHKQQIVEAESMAQGIRDQIVLAKRDDLGAEAITTTIQSKRDEQPTLDWVPYDQAINDAVRTEAAAWSALTVAKAAQTKAAALIKGGNCPECGQSIASGSLAHQTMTVEISDAPHKAAAAHVEACKQSKTDASAWLSAAVTQWRTELDALPQPKPSQVVLLDRSLGAAVQRTDDLKVAENPYTIAAQQAQKQRYDLLREAQLYRDREREAAHQAQLGSAWVEVLAPRGVRAHMASSALASIEVEANRWLAVLSDGRFSVEFPPTSTTRRTGNVREEIQTIIRCGDTKMPFLAFSGGEKRRINLAVDLAVAATFARGGALNLSLLVLDEEVFSGLDEVGKGAVAAIINHAGVDDVVVIDHDSRLSGVLPREVHVTLGSDGYSRIKEVS